MYWPQWLIDWVNEDSKKWLPVPRLRFGFIKGPSVRWEQSGATEGTDRYLTALANKNLADIGSGDVGLPADYGITHLQKQSRYGFIITSPFCFYVWWQIKPQDEHVGDGGVTVTIPGSEICATFSVGKARWDAGAGAYMKLRLQAGLHWD